MSMYILHCFISIHTCEGLINFFILFSFFNHFFFGIRAMYATQSKLNVFQLFTVDVKYEIYNLQFVTVLQYANFDFKYMENYFSIHYKIMTKYLRNKHLTYFTQDTQKKIFTTHNRNSKKKKVCIMYRRSAEIQ